MPTHYSGTEAEKRALDLIIKLARAGDAVAQRTMGAVTEAGLTPTQFGVLETLYHLGHLMPSQLAEKHLRSRNNLTVVIDKLEKQGYVKRLRCPNDRRAQWVDLTELGRALIERLLPIHVAALVKDVSVLTTDEQLTLSCLLKKLGRQIA